ncbi:MULTISPECIES: hypothetical protein [unclassified Corynebacterium]|uniref:hypothetical protein n=1 Tax=unclassified Corynebacterium TaxID=2624378 RepID=UPI0029C9FC12|nr:MULTISPECIES: hypothetical protein [unclassified Corynebacterium]WPF66541.1 hypothetical protein OLX12_02085 [Corynebacterium sp. 22KM0430]WPF69030.1 hypothetical protein OLW90_02080 [Corynebacterium sp. 21KM1197]
MVPALRMEGALTRATRNATATGDSLHSIYPTTSREARTVARWTMKRSNNMAPAPHTAATTQAIGTAAVSMQHRPGGPKDGNYLARMGKFAGNRTVSKNPA